MKQARIIILILSLIVFAGFAFFRIRERVQEDNTPPVISAVTDTLEVSVSVTDKELLSGMQAFDNLDGDVTGSLFVVSRSRFISPATLQVNYAAFDRNDNVGTYVRTVHFTDYEPPRFSLKAPLRFPAGNSSYNYLAHLSAYDTLDGNLTSQIKIIRGPLEVQSEDISTRSITLQVTNSAGDSAVLELVATFEDYATYAKHVVALSDYICYTKVGVAPDYEGLMIGIYSAGTTKSIEGLRYDEERDITIDASLVDLNTPGIYEAYYTLYTRAASGEEQEVQGTSTLFVVVEEE